MNFLAELCNAWYLLGEKKNYINVNSIYIYICINNVKLIDQHRVICDQRYRCSMTTR